MAIEAIAEGVGQAAEGIAEGAKEAAVQVAEVAQNAAQSAADSAKVMAEQATQRVQEVAVDAGNKAGEAAKQAAESAKQKAQAVSDKAQSELQEKTRELNEKRVEAQQDRAQKLANENGNNPDREMYKEVESDVGKQEEASVIDKPDPDADVTHEYDDYSKNPDMCSDFTEESMDDLMKENDMGEDVQEQIDKQNEEHAREIREDDLDKDKYDERRKEIEEKRKQDRKAEKAEQKTNDKQTKDAERQAKKSEKKAQKEQDKADKKADKAKDAKDRKKADKAAKKAERAEARAENDKQFYANQKDKSVTMQQRNEKIANMFIGDEKGLDSIGNIENLLGAIDGASAGGAQAQAAVNRMNSLNSKFDEFFGMATPGTNITPKEPSSVPIPEKITDAVAPKAPKEKEADDYMSRKYSKYGL